MEDNDRAQSIIISGHIHYKLFSAGKSRARTSLTPGTQTSLLTVLEGYPLLIAIILTSRKEIKMQLCSILYFPLIQSFHYC